MTQATKTTCDGCGELIDRSAHSITVMGDGPYEHFHNRRCQRLKFDKEALVSDEQIQTALQAALRGSSVPYAVAEIRKQLNLPKLDDDPPPPAKVAVAAPSPGVIGLPARTVDEIQAALEQLPLQEAMRVRVSLGIPDGAKA